MSPGPLVGEARSRREMADLVVAEVRQVLAHPGAPRAVAAMLSQAVCLGFERAFSRDGVQVEALALEAVRQAQAAGYEYPTEVDLARLRAWPMTDPIGFLEAARGLWWMADWGWPDEVMVGATFEVSTGGWSGNELIIEAMQAAHQGLLWHYVWEQTRKGGHYTFTARAIT